MVVVAAFLMGVLCTTVAVVEVGQLAVALKMQSVSVRVHQYTFTLKQQIKESNNGLRLHTK